MKVLIHSWTIRTARLTERLEHFTGSKLILLLTGCFYTKDALSVWTNLGKHLYFVWLCVSSIKMSTSRIMRLDELSFETRLERRTTKGSSSGLRIMRLVPVLILETHNQTNYKTFAEVRPDG